MLAPPKAAPPNVLTYVTATVAYLAVFRLAVLAFSTGVPVA